MKRRNDVSTDNNRSAWDQLRTQLASRNSMEVISIPRRRGFPHPRDAGARLTATWPVGQVADYQIDGNPPLVVREFSDRWEAFIDDARLTSQVLEGVERDPSKAMYVGAALLGGAIGTSMSNKRQAMFVGVGVGLLLAAVLDASLNEQRRRGK